jgi:hypothetical protein
MKALLRFVIMLSLGVAPAAFAVKMPPLNANAWNLIFVQSFEPSAKTNNLSAQGFNHALLFGQRLNTITAGKHDKVKKILSFATDSNPQDMTALQSIEPYALLNSRSVSHVLAGSGGVADYGSPAYYISNLLNNEPRGDYIIAMPAAMINNTLKSLGVKTSANDAITPGNYNQYLVLSIQNGKTALTVYEDGLTPSTQFPYLELKPSTGYSCPEKAASFSVSKPKSSKYRFNTNQTIYFVRHVEAHPNKNFENGNYMCKGQWRAIGVTKVLNEKFGGKVDNIFTTNPNNIIGCTANCSYIRPSLTISPFAIQNAQPLKLAQFQWDDAPTLAASLFTSNTPYSSEAFNNATTLVAWEHGNIQKAVQYLIGAIYESPGSVKKIPAWAFTDYDTIWELKTDNEGNLTFSNSCEGINTDSLPSTCPAFPLGLVKQ